MAANDAGALYNFFTKIKSIFLATSRHSIEIDSLQVDHRFGNIVFFLSFFEESAFIDDAELDELVDIFGGEFLFWKGFLILHVPSPFLVTEVES